MVARVLGDTPLTAIADLLETMRLERVLFNRARQSHRCRAAARIYFVPSSMRLNLPRAGWSTESFTIALA
jgi:hypothetical protein